MWSFIDRNYSLELERDDNNFILRKYFNTNRIYLKYNVFKFVFLNRLYLFASPHTITLLHHYSFSHYIISKLCTFPNINPGRFLVRHLSRFLPSLGHSVISCTTTWSINAISISIILFQLLRSQCFLTNSCLTILIYRLLLRGNIYIILLTFNHNYRMSGNFFQL